MKGFMQTKTLAPENQLKIRCPVFPSETKIAGCLVLKDMVWRGEGPPDKRQGCQCAMMAGKCPIPLMIKQMLNDGTDQYHSDVEATRDFDYSLTDQVGRVLVPDSMMRRFSLSAQEEAIFARRNDEAKGFVEKAPKRARRPDPVMKIDEVKAAAKQPAPVETKPDAVSIAAQTGDMTAAINAQINNA